MVPDGVNNVLQRDATQERAQRDSSFGVDASASPACEAPRASVAQQLQVETSHLPTDLFASREGLAATAPHHSSQVCMLSSTAQCEQHAAHPHVLHSLQTGPSHFFYSGCAEYVPSTNVCVQPQQLAHGAATWQRGFSTSLPYVQQRHFSHPPPSGSASNSSLSCAVEGVCCAGEAAEACLVTWDPDELPSGCIPILVDRGSSLTMLNADAAHIIAASTSLGHGASSVVCWHRKGSSRQGRRRVCYSR